MSTSVALSVALFSCATAPAAPSDTASGRATGIPEKSVTPSPTAAAEAVIVVLGADVTGESVTASGYVSGFLEDGGNCSFSFGRDSREVTAVSVGIADRQTTSCGTVTVAMSQFSSGSWTVTLNYTPVSSSEIVTSVPSQLEIP